MRSFQQDYKYGVSKQPVILRHIRNFFKDNSIRELPEKYAKHDFVGSGISYELKSRTCSSYQYPDTVFPTDKVLTDEEGREMKQIFLFNFTDKLTYIEYDKDLFATFKCAPFRRHQRSDFNDREKLYYHIPVSKLKTVCLY